MEGMARPMLDLVDSHCVLPLRAAPEEPDRVEARIPLEASIRDFFFEITLIMVALAPFIALSTSGDLRHVGGDNGGIDDYDAHGARLDGGVLSDAGA